MAFRKDKRNELESVVLQEITELKNRNTMAENMLQNVLIANEKMAQNSLVTNSMLQKLMEVKIESDLIFISLS
jgi:hypothetical protein